MKHASLVRFLDGDLPQALFAAEIAAEVCECTHALKSTRHGSIFITDGPDSVLTRDRCLRLLHAVADKTLTPEAASFVADCIIMGQAFEWEDDSVGEAICFLADGDTWPLSEEDVRAHILSLG